MNIPFSLRFFQKIELYQQIRKGRGLFKNKNLWEQEKAILLWAYSKKHQHLHSIPDYETIKSIIADYKGVNKQCISKVKETIGNLLYKGFVEVTTDGKSIESYYLPYEDIKGARPTLLGILAGEVLNEIDNKNLFVRYYSILKYEFLIKIAWLAILLGSMKFIFPELFSLYFNPVEKYLQQNAFVLPLVVIGILILNKIAEIYKND